MKTDTLFYQLFQAAPSSLFELLGIPQTAEYHFTPKTLKSLERRLDGFFLSADPNAPLIFLEVQGYHDNFIYWRLFHEIAAYYDQERETAPFLAVVLFIDERFDPGPGILSSWEDSGVLKRAYLPECLEHLPAEAGALTILQPITLKSPEELPARAPQWIENLRRISEDPSRENFWLELLEYMILQRFPKLSLQEIRMALHLTPLDQTVAGQELIQIGHAEGFVKGRMEGRMEGELEGLMKGRMEGEIIGKIQLLQKFLKLPVQSSEELAQKSPKELQALLDALEPRLLV